MAQRKIRSQAALMKIIKNLKKQGKKIIFARGCFDLLHPGHILYLKKAKSLGDILVVWVNVDQSVQILKGENRPINNLKSRMEMLSVLDIVDFVSSFRDEDGLEIVRKFKPDIVVVPQISVDYARAIQGYGGKIVVVPVLKKYSTSQIIQKILKNYGFKFNEEKKRVNHRQ